MNAPPDEAKRSSFDEGAERSDEVLAGKQVEEVRDQSEIARLHEQTAQMRRENRLAQKVANGAVVAAIAQVVIVDAGFVVYGFSNHWHIPAAAISAWLGATVVQVFAVVLVVARYLFPTRGRER